MAEAGDKGIPLEDYIKVQSPSRSCAPSSTAESCATLGSTPTATPVRATMAARSRRKVGGCGLSTTIDRERRRCGGALRGSDLPRDVFRQGVPRGHGGRHAGKSQRRPAIKFDLVLKILADIDQREGLASNLQPAEIEKKVLPRFRPLWAKLRSDDDTDPPASRTLINRAYQEFLSRSAVSRDDHGRDDS